MMLEDLYAPGAVVSAMAQIPKAARPDILFLSAKLGLARHDSWATPYGALMDEAQAKAWSVDGAMRERFANTLRRFQGGAVLVAAGGRYRQVFEAWIGALKGDARLDGVQIGWAPPAIGRMRQAIKRFALGDVSMCVAHSERSDRGAIVDAERARSNMTTPGTPAARNSKSQLARR
jgi:hypothetical protein